jgi:hypothetical protein
MSDLMLNYRMLRNEKKPLFMYEKNVLNAQSETWFISLQDLENLFDVRAIQSVIIQKKQKKSLMHWRH